MSNKIEYSIVKRTDTYGDDTHFVFRQTKVPAGIIVAEELARLDYEDVSQTSYPSGLIEPTQEELALYGGVASDEGQSNSVIDTAEYGPAVDITEIERSITDFVVKALTGGRTPTFAWNDLASEDEIDAFKSAVGRVQSAHGIAQPELGSDSESSYGLYL